jgi:hypothetical protein
MTPLVRPASSSVDRQDRPAAGVYVPRYGQFGVKPQVRSEIVFKLGNSVCSILFSRTALACHGNDLDIPFHSFMGRHKPCPLIEPPCFDTPLVRCELY